MQVGTHSLGQFIFSLPFNHQEEIAYDCLASTLDNLHRQPSVSIQINLQSTLNLVSTAHTGEQTTKGNTTKIQRIS